MIDGKRIIDRYQRYISRDGNFRTGWDTLAPYLQPTRTGVLTQGLKVPGTNQTQDLFDSTSPTVVETAASFVWGNVMNPATKWVTMEPRESQLRDLDEVREWADEAMKVLLAAYQSSNFYYEAYEALIDYLGFGTCCLHVEERNQAVNQKPAMGFRGFVFRNYAIGTFAIDENFNGEPDIRMSCYSLSARAIKDEFGEANLPVTIASALKDQPERQFEIVHSIEPRPYSEQKSRAGRHMAYASAWIEKESCKVLRESGYEEFPDAIARYQKTAGEVYGRSPGFTALPDIRTLNKLKYDSFESLEMAVKPPLLSAAEMGSIGTIQLFPGGLNTVKLRPGMTDVRQAMAPFETGTKWDIVNLKEEELRASIERVFHVKQIRDLLEAEKMQTAYEYAQKLALLNKMLGPIWGRMQAEFLNRLNERCFNVLLRRGAFPRPPDVLFERGAEFDWQYEGPLAKAQRSGEIEAIMAYAQQAAVISQFDPRALDRFDGDEAMKVLADVGGVPGKVVRGDDQVAALREAKRQAQEQETMKEDLMAATQGARNIAPLAQKLLPEGGAAAA